jgi:hypothetical protein
MTSRALVVAVLTWVTLLVSMPAARAYDTAYGHTASGDRQLRQGCHAYRYHYVVKAPTDDWFFETRLIDPRGHHLATGDFAPGSDPANGHAHFIICGVTTRPGTFTIKARLDWYDAPGPLGGSPTDHVVWFEPARFTLSRD